MEQEPNIEKVDKDVLIAFAKERPPRDPEVETMLLRWIEESAIREEAGAESIDYLKVSITHSAMKYRLGFLTKEEVLEELEETRQGIVAEYGDTTELHQEISDLMYNIEDGLFV